MSSDDIELTDVTLDTVDRDGFFCYMSKRKSEGYQRKLAWVKQRLAEGMRIKIIRRGGRGFIEYIPGEYAWRAVNKAKGYMMIHCLWIVGKKNHRQGQGGYLLDQCVQDARQAGMRGVAMVTSSGVWLADKGILLKHGFEVVDQVPPHFSLLVKRFDGSAPLPSFPKNWTRRWQQYPNGLTVFRTDQCPYIVDATNMLLEGATELGIDSRVVELTRAQELRKQSPTPYGVFGVVYEGKLLSYHYLLKKDLPQRIAEISA